MVCLFSRTHKFVVEGIGKRQVFGQHADKNLGETRVVGFPQTGIPFSGGFVGVIVLRQDPNVCVVGMGFGKGQN